jgi:tRNA nucleotidyltransferase/poly(A) polymerase
MKEQALSVIKTLEEAGHVAGLVGGCVRDGVLGRDPKDFDVATSARPEEVEALFQRTLGVGKQFGIVVVLLDDEQIEVATFRKDGAYTDGRRPDEVCFVDAVEFDLGRRDFTMNALFEKADGSVVDPFGGVEDIKNKTIRFVGNPRDRVAEDKLRVLRAFRFSSQLGFGIDGGSIEAIKEVKDLSGVSAERVGAEMNKLLLGPFAAEALAVMAAVGTLQVAIPEIEPIVRCFHESPFHTETWEPFCDTVFAHTLWVVKHATENSKNLPKEKRLALMWSALLHDVEKPSCKVFKE